MPTNNTLPVELNDAPRIVIHDDEESFLLDLVEHHAPTEALRIGTRAAHTGDLTEVQAFIQRYAADEAYGMTLTSDINDLTAVCHAMIVLAGLNFAAAYFDEDAHELSTAQEEEEDADSDDQG